jgi:hypothetical protein
MVDSTKNMMNSIALKIVGPQVEDTKNRTHNETLELWIIARLRKDSQYSQSRL